MRLYSNKIQRIQRKTREGATIVLMLFLLVVVFIFVAFAVDIGRIQLAQLKLQTSADLASRAGAEALARGVGDTDDLASFEAAIRAECDMLMQKNNLFGAAVAFDSNADIHFGIAQPTDTAGPSGGNVGKKGKGKPIKDQVRLGKGNGKKRFDFSDSNSGVLTLQSNSIRVAPDISQFPLVFGKFLGRDDVALASFATAKVQDRDIVVVLDRSTSMFDHDAGSVSVNDYPANLLQLEDELYDSTHAFFPGGPSASETRHSEFETAAGSHQLSKVQALKLAILKFRQVIDETPGHEMLGLTSYSESADPAVSGVSPVGAVDITSGLSAAVRTQMIDQDDLTTGNASALESHESGYDNFDYAYLGMRLTGSTNIVDGIEVGTEILYGPGHRTFGQPILLVLTDGRHNTTNAGDAATPLAAAQAAVAAHPDILIYTITFGLSAEQGPMIDVANAGRGKHFHANNFTQLADIFTELAASAGVTIIE